MASSSSLRWIPLREGKELTAPLFLSSLLSSFFFLCLTFTIFLSLSLLAAYRNISSQKSLPKKEMSMFTLDLALPPTYAIFFPFTSFMKLHATFLEPLLSCIRVLAIEDRTDLYAILCGNNLAPYGITPKIFLTSNVAQLLRERDTVYMREPLFENKGKWGNCCITRSNIWRFSFFLSKFHNISGQYLIVFITHCKFLWAQT